MELEVDFWPLVLLPLCICVHEWAHAVLADASGDPTPRSQGRLSLNPTRHLHPLGTVALPLVLFFATRGAVLFAFAKPVEIQPDRFRKPRIGLFLVSLAGPVANLLVGGSAAAMWRLLPGPETLLDGLLWLAILSVSMFVLNLVPIPPLDGSRMVASLLPARVAEHYLERGIWVLPGVVVVFTVAALLVHVDLLDVLMRATALPLLEWILGK